MPRESPFAIVLSKEERVALQAQARQYTSPYCNVIRAKIVLLAAQGLSNDIIASRLDTPRQIVSKWRKRFALARLPSLEDETSGRAPRPLFPPASSFRSKLSLVNFPIDWDCLCPGCPSPKSSVRLSRRAS